MTPSTAINILLIEDNLVDVQGLKRSFRKHHLENIPIYWASDGIDALQQLRGCNVGSAIPKPFFILLDLNMPRMNGIEFLKVLRADSALHSTIVFVLTTSDNEEDKLASYELNVAGYLRKGHMGDSYTKLVDFLRTYWNTIEFPTYTGNINKGY
jgi:CheY-like chemotaxis protein